MYPRPKQTGGTLIRQVISLFKKHSAALPVSGRVWIAVSGGADSVALAHLLVHYGRKVAHRDQIRLIHINHHWRGAESDREMKRVTRLAKNWGVPIQTVELDPKHLRKGVSPEDAARQERGRVFKELLAAEPGVVLTAHHADDLAETLMWRFFTGQWMSHAEGIRFHFEGQVRPFLSVTKSQIFQYVKEEKLKFYTDKTNQDPRYLRGKIRLHVVPVLEKVFPKWAERVIEFSDEFQNSAPQANHAFRSFLAQALPTARRAQLKEWGARFADLKAHRKTTKQELRPGLRAWVEFDADTRQKRWVLEEDPSE